MKIMIMMMKKKEKALNMQTSKFLQRNLLEFVRILSKKLIMKKKTMKRKVMKEKHP